MKFSNPFTRSLVLLLLSFVVAGSRAETSSAPGGSALRQWAEQDYLFGDWGGLRSDLSKHGVDFEFVYAGSVPNNLDGGIQSGSVYQGGLLMSLDLDSQKLLNYEGGTLHVSGLWLHGHKPFSAEYVGDLNRVNLLDFDNTARLWEFWYRQKFLDSRFSLKVGELSVDGDFLVPEYYSSFGQFTLINQTFFYPSLPYDLFDIEGLPARNHGLPTTPLAAPGAVLRWEAEPRFYAQSGVYGGNPDQLGTGTHIQFSKEEGALFFGEIGFRLNPDKNQPGLGGSYKLGAYYHTGDFVDVYDGVIWAFFNAGGFPAPDVRDHSGNWGAYFLAEQQIYNEHERTDPAQQGLVAFFRLLVAPSDRNLAQLEVDGGLVWKGLIPGRDWDTLALAASYMEISDDIGRAQRDANALAPGSFSVADHETVLELSYKAQLTAWWTLQGSLEHVIHPGGSPGLPDATALIFQTTLRF